MISRKEHSKKESLKNNKRLRVFLLFFLLSFLFWMLIKLSKNYISDVEFNLVYTDEPKNKLFEKNPDEKVVLTLKTMGFKLINYGLKKRELNYSLNDIKKIKGSNYYSLTKSNINLLQAQLSAETTVLKIKPDTLYFEFGVKKSKKVKIISHVNLQFKPGYNLVKEQTIEPDKITISGPENVIDSINEIHTEIIELNDVSESFINKINLVSPTNSISLSSDHVTIKGNVEKITEGTFLLPYKVINIPNKYLISTYPKEVKVIFQVALKDYNKISENSFKIECDYKQTDDNNLEYLIPKIVEKPEILFDVKVVPNKIEFLIKK
ncbi:MAG: YbbR-like domain-containing protein [Flavobacteriaceae bacterium]|nr:YbbR-like domain-containing protein [Flavobacteriaceae bacterium]